MSIKARADHINNVNIAGQLVDMQPVLICAELDEDGTMKTSPGAVVKGQLFSIAQTTADPVQILADIADWIGISKPELRQYMLRISGYPRGGDISFGDELRVFVGPVATGMKLQVPDIGINPEPHVFPLATAFNEIHADIHDWSATETHNFALYVEAIYQPRGV